MVTKGVREPESSPRQSGCPGECHPCLADPDPLGRQDTLLTSNRLTAGLKTGSGEAPEVSECHEASQYVPPVPLSLVRHVLALQSPADGKNRSTLGGGVSSVASRPVSLHMPFFLPSQPRQIRRLKITLKSQSSSPQLTRGEGGPRQYIPTMILDPVSPQPGKSHIAL